MLKDVAIRADIPPEDVSNHVMRRSGAMMMDETGVPIEDIFDMLGHKSLKQTREYLSRTAKKMEKAQYTYALYLEGVRSSMRANPMPIAAYCRATPITR